MDYYNLVSGWYSLRLRQTEKKKKTSGLQAKTSKQQMLPKACNQPKPSNQNKQLSNQAIPTSQGVALAPGTAGLLLGSLHTAQEPWRPLQLQDCSRLYSSISRNDATTCGNFIGKQMDVR